MLDEMARELTRGQCGLVIFLYFMIQILPYVLFFPGFLFLALPLIILGVVIVFMQALWRDRRGPD